MSASRSSAVWWDYRRGLFPRPFTIYAGNVEDVSLGVGDFARALTNAERRNQRRGDGARRGSGTRQDSAGQPWRARTEGRTEAGSSSKDYADAQGDAVNQRAPKSVEGKDLAPHVGLEPTTLRLTAQCSCFGTRDGTQSERPPRDSENLCPSPIGRPDDSKPGVFTRIRSSVRNISAVRAPDWDSLARRRRARRVG